MKKLVFDIQRFVMKGTNKADKMINTDSGNIVYGYAGHDSIYNTGSSSKIYGGDGNDTIENHTYMASLYGDAGNDYIISDDTNTLNGGAGADTLYGRKYAYIVGGADNDVITLTGGTVIGGAGNDKVTIRSSDDYRTYYNFAYGHGNDVVYGADGLTYVSMTTGNYFQTIKSGNDIILRAVNTKGATSGSIRFKDTSAIGGVLGTMVNNKDAASGEGVKYNGTTWPDMMTNTYAKVTIYSGNGDDNITNSGNYVSVVAGNGADYIVNSGNDSTILGQAGNDSVYLYGGGQRNFINLGADNDSLYAEVENYATVNGVAGNDKIIGNFVQSSLVGGAGNDVISLSGNYGGNTINAGVGNDKIYVADNTGSKIYEYAYGDGYDTVYGAGINDTLHLASGAYQSVMSNDGNDLIVKIGQNGTYTGSVTFKDTRTLHIDGKLQIVNKKASTVFEGDSDDNSMFNSGSRATVYGYNGNDSIVNQGTYTQVYAGNGDDTIQNIAAGTYSTLDAGDGDDLIKGAFTNVSIVGGSGNDVISVNGGGAGNKVNAGKGNDTIYTGKNTAAKVIQYANGDGNDVIYGYNPKTVIKITDGAYTTSTVAGSKDAVITITNSASSTVPTGTITLKGAVGKNLDIRGTKVTESATPQEVIKRFMFALDYTSQSGIAAVNQAVNVASNGYFKNVAAVINSMVKNRKASSNATAFLKNYCGIDFTNADTGAITGLDAGGGTEKTNESIVPEEGSLDTTFTAGNFKVGNATLKLSGAYSSLGAGKKFIWQALKTWWAQNSMNLISESYGSNYNLGSNTISIAFVNSSSNFLARAWNSYNSAGVGHPTKVEFNMNYYPSIDTSNKNGYDTKKGQTYLDRVLAHELTHSAMSEKILYFNNLPTYIKEGMAELTHGIDDQRKSGILAFAANETKMRQCLVNSAGYFNVSGVNAPSYVGGYTFLRYLAKQGSDHYGQTANANAALVDSNAITTEGSVLTVNPTFKETTVDLSDYSSKIKKVDASKLTNGIAIVGNVNANSIKGGSGNDTISGNSGNDTLVGGAGNDQIFGDGGKNLLKGGSGKDTLFGSGNDTLIGGGGKDKFVYVSDTAGNAVITDYTEKDKIEVNGNSISETVYSGQDVVFKIGESTLTVKNGKGKNINISETTQSYVASLSEGIGDIFGEDKFISQDATIDDVSQITDSGFSEYNLGNADYTSLAQNYKTALAYSGTN